MLIKKTCITKIDSVKKIFLHHIFRKIAFDKTTESRTVITSIYRIYGLSTVS